MASPIQCPNCSAPLGADPQQPTVTCEYCHVRSRNPLYERPRTAPRVVVSPPAPAPRRSAWRWLGPLLVLLVVLPAAWRGCESGLRKSTRRSQAKASIKGKYSSPYKSSRANHSVEPAAELALAAKLVPYMSCYAETRQQMQGTRTSYARWVGDMAAGPSCAGQLRPFPANRVHGAAHCGSLLSAAHLKAPRLAELERAARAYAGAVAAVDDALSRARRYYTGEDYRDDACAGGKALHRELAAAWDTAHKESRALAGALFPRFWRLVKERMARAERAEGKMLRYHFGAVLLEADRMASTLARQVKVKTPDVAAMKAAVARLEAALAALRAADREHHRGLKPVYVGSVVRMADDLVAAAKQYRRRREAGEPLARTDAWRMAHGYAHMVKGSFSRVMYYKYRLLIYAARARYR